MPRVDVTLLYQELSASVLHTLCDALNIRLRRLGVQVQREGKKDPLYAVYSGCDWEITQKVLRGQMPARMIHGAMDSILSQTVLDELAEIAETSTARIAICIEPIHQARTPETWLEAQRVAHAATTIVSTMHPPSAVLWYPSKQLVTGAQYHQMATDRTPWSLVAPAQLLASPHRGRANLRIDHAAELIGRPILVADTVLSVDRAYAAALGFLRQTIETGEPIGDGHSFDPDGGGVVTVAHVAATTDDPQGCFRLSAAPVEGARDQGPASHQPLPEAVKLDEHPTRSEESERTRSMAISYVMLVLLPPVGVVLMFLNAFARPSTARTGLIAMIVLAILMVIGAYTFLNLDTKRTAALHAPIKIEIQPLVD